jgi:hypothetical protein
VNNDDLDSLPRYRILGTAQETVEHPHIEFRSQVYWGPGIEDTVKDDAERLRTFFGLKTWEVQIERTKDQWERVEFDD